MPTTTVSHEAVLQAVYTFLLNSGYTHTLQALQLESRRAFNVVLQTSADGATGEDKAGDAVSQQGLREAVMSGHWDVVLGRYLSTCLLPEDKSFALYEHILTEMLQLHGCISVGRGFFDHSPVFHAMKRHSPAQHHRLQALCESAKPLAGKPRTGSDAQEIPAWCASKRAKFAEELCRTVHFVSKQQIGQRDRLPWLVAADAAGLIGVSEPASAEGTRSIQNRAGKSSANRGSNGHDAEEGEEGEHDERVRKVHRTDASTASDALLHSEATIRASIPSHVGWRHSFGKADDLGATVITCRSATLRGALGPVALFGRSSGEIALLSLSSKALHESWTTFPASVLSLALDDAGPVDAAGEKCNTWLAVGYRGGAVRIYDVDLRKLVRKFEAVCTHGVHHLSFAGGDGVRIQGHRRLLLVAGLSGSLALLAIDQGIVLQTIRDAHEGQYISGLARCVTGTAEVFVTSGDDGFLRRWRATEAGALLPTTSEGSLGSVAQWTLSDLMASGGRLKGAVPSHLCAAQTAAVDGNDWFCCVSRCNKFVVFSLGLGIAILGGELHMPVTSITALSSARDTQLDTGGRRLRLLVATCDGKVHGYRFETTNQDAKRVWRDAPDTSSDALVNEFGGAVAELRICSAWEVHDGSFVACSSAAKMGFVVGEGV